MLEDMCVKEGLRPAGGFGVSQVENAVVLEKALESPLNCKEINQSILKEISLEYSLEGMMQKLKLQYFGHLM